MDLQRLPFLASRRLDNLMLLNRAQAWEFSLFALCIWREARGEEYRGKLGVAWSIRNRVFTKEHTWWGAGDWEDVILKPWQYSSFNANDPNSGKIPGDPAKDPAWNECLWVAEEVYSNLIADPTGGATHYYAESLKPPPSWAETAQFKVQLGHHLFYLAS